MSWLGDAYDKAVELTTDAIEWSAETHQAAVNATTDTFMLIDQNPDRAALMIGQGVEKGASEILATPLYIVDGAAELTSWAYNAATGNESGENSQFGLGLGEWTSATLQKGLDALPVALGVASKESALAIPKNELEASAQSLGKAGITALTGAAALKSTGILKAPASATTANVAGKTATVSDDATAVADKIQSLEKSRNIHRAAIGGATLVVAGPIAGMTIDNALGNPFRNALTNGKLGIAGNLLTEGAEKALSLSEWVADQEATWVSGGFESYLIKQGKLSEDDPDYDRSSKLIEAAGYVATGHVITGALKLNDKTDDIEGSEIMAAYNTAKQNNPKATPKELATITFENLRAELKQKDLEQEATANATQENTPHPLVWLNGLKPGEMGDSSKLSAAFAKAMNVADDFEVKTGQDLGFTFNLMAGITKVVNFVNALTNGALDGVASKMNKHMLEITQTRVKEMLDDNTVTKGTLNMLGNTPELEPLLSTGQAPAPAPQ